MKRKRNSDTMQAYDVVLTDANGRSIRAHRALLVDKSDYFARVLEDHNLKELQLNEHYLIELIHYLYAHDSDYGRPGTDAPPNISDESAGPIVTNSDVEILMRMLLLSKKYSFRQLYRSLLNEINYKLSPQTAIAVYKYARQLEIVEFIDQTKMMILSWLPQLQSSEEFLSLNEDSIRDIFSAESPEIESESKLDALSAWWSSNKQANMTDLWVNFMMSN
jgi:hypothetical protein